MFWVYATLGDAVNLEHAEALIISRLSDGWVLEAVMRSGKRFTIGAPSSSAEEARAWLDHTLDGIRGTLAAGEQVMLA